MLKKIKRNTRRYVVYLFNVFMPKWLCRISIFFTDSGLLLLAVGTDLYIIILKFYNGLLID